jgi:hypothetical protein
MLHWNSFWVPNGADGNAPAAPLATPDNPWPVEQILALQTRSWEQMVTAGQAWWSIVTAAWSVPGWALSSWTEALPPPAGEPRPPQPAARRTRPAGTARRKPRA